MLNSLSFTYSLPTMFPQLFSLLPVHNAASFVQGLFLLCFTDVVATGCFHYAYHDFRSEMQRAGVSVENSISCICCGGRFVYPGGRYREHLAREHKVSGQALQFLFEASLHRKQHSSLPIISSDPNQNSPCGSKTALTKSAQSEETDIKVEPDYQTAEYLTVTPDIHGFPEKIKHPLPPPAAQVGTPLSSDLHCYFDCGHYLPPSKSMEMEIHLKLKHSKESPEDLVKAREFLKWEKSITKRSMSVYRCAVCCATLEGVSSFYDHIRKHGLEWAQYKLEFGSSCVKSSNFKCKICSRVVKYESSTVQKHLKNVHRLYIVILCSD